MKGVTITRINPAYSDERGIITDILNENLGHVGLITCKKGSIRGNHYHKKSIQYSYILSGKFEVLLALSDNINKVEKLIISSGNLIIISPKVVHTFKAIEDSSMIDMVSLSRADNKYEEDVIKGVILKE